MGGGMRPDMRHDMRHETTLRYVDAIARHRSIRRAAEALALTPSALNRRLLALEEEIGAPLFERRAQGVRLSAAGEVFIHHARRQMAEMARVRAAIEDMKGARRGHVTLAVDGSLPHAALAGRIAAHRSEHPGVTFEVVPCGRGEAAMLLEGYGADIALAVEPEASGAFATLASAPVRLLALVGAGHAASGADVARLHEVLAEPLALPPAGASARFVLERAAARRDLPVRPVVSGPDELTVPLVRAGAAIGIALALPDAADGREAWGRPAPAGIGVVPLDPRDVPPARVHVGQMRGRTLPVPAARFADAILQAVARAAGEG